MLSRFLGAIETVGDAAYRTSRRVVPDPFVLALLLTFATFLLAAFWGFRLEALDADGDGAVEKKEAPGWDFVLAPFDTEGAAGKPDGVLTAEELPRGPGRLVAATWAWVHGFWELLGFAMQMCLILVTGFAVATSPPVRAVIDRLAEIPRTTRQAASLAAFLAMSAAFLNWGLGLIVGALFARQVGVVARRTGRPIHYPLVVAAGYVGLMVWHGGFSGSAPLKATEGDIVGYPVPLGETILSPVNLVVAGGLLALVPIFFALLAPRDPARIQGAPEDLAADHPGPPTPGERTVAAWLERSFLLVLLVAVAGGLFLHRYYFVQKGWRNLGLNEVNFTLLVAGLVLHGSPRAYVQAVTRAASGCGGIILQFPFYAGILGLMKYSGLLATLAGGMASLSSPATHPVLTFFSAGLVNLFIPSGGGQWAVQGPVVIESARALGIPPGKVILALAYGDEWTNMMQPFWALPLLALTRLEARDIAGYTFVVMVLATPIFVLPLLL